MGSPAQLGDILFDKMSLPGARRANTPPGPTFLRTSRRSSWRQPSKLKSTYTDALQEHINPETGRVHTSYSIAGANTGRLARPI